MAHHEPLLDNPPTQEMAHKSSDYDRLHEVAEMGCDRLFAIGLLVVMMIS